MPICAKISLSARNNPIRWNFHLVVVMAIFRDGKSTRGPRTNFAVESIPGRWKTRRETWTTHRRPLTTNWKVAFNLISHRTQDPNHGLGCRINFLHNFNNFIIINVWLSRSFDSESNIRGSNGYWRSKWKFSTRSKFVIERWSWHVEIWIN